MITVGMLYDAQNLLSKVEASPVTADALLGSFKKLEVADFASVLSLAQKCQWIEIDQTNTLLLSTSGRNIHGAPDVRQQLRQQIRDVLSFISPSWAKKIADGRTEASSVMPEAVRQMFDEAGLFDEWSDELVGWWDMIGLAARSRKSERNLKTGRRAEKLSMDYEQYRTGKRPQWTCAESNYAGYDLLSIVEKADPRPCAIEVKGTTLHVNEATFTLSRNEWGVADANSDYRLHLWLVRAGQQDPQKDLRVIPASSLVGHIPTDNGVGRWETARIPFRDFWD
jgi:hypothetical protein